MIFVLNRIPHPSDMRRQNKASHLKKNPLSQWCLENKATSPFNSIVGYKNVNIGQPLKYCRKCYIVKVVLQKQQQQEKI